MSPIIRYILLVALYLLSLISVRAQETILVGRVFDRLTKAPIENVNIYFKRTDIGTSTNADGFFMLRTFEEHPERVVVSAMGYRKVELKMKQAHHASVELELVEEFTALQDVFVMPGVNPALALMKKVRLSANLNNVRNNPQIATNTREKTTMFLSDFTPDMLQRRMWRTLKSGVVEAADSSLLIPIYYSDKQYALQGKSKEMTAQVDSILTPISEQGFAAVLGGIEQTLDFYQNAVPLFGQSFVSPLSINSSRFYHFFLVDSVPSQRGKTYRVNFKPKNAQNPVFSGSLFVDSATYALQRIEATVPGRNKLNFIQSLHIQQSFSETPQTPFTLDAEHVSLLFDYALPVRSDSLRVFPSVYAARSTVAEHTDAAVEVPEADKYVSDSSVIYAMDMLAQTPLVRTAQYIVTTLVTRHANLRYVEIGDLRHVLSFNPTEQVRLGLPLRTSEQLMEHFVVGGYGIYGFRDKEWKYKGYAQAKLPIEQRHVFGLSYQDDYTDSEVDDFDRLIQERGLNNTSVSLPNFLQQLAYRRYILLRKREATLSVENSWTPNFETILNMRKGWMSYGDPAVSTLDRPYDQLPHYAYHKVQLTGRFSWQERTVDKHFQRLYVRNHLPILMLGLEYGNYQIESAKPYTHYGKVQLMLHQKLPLGIAGTLNYLLQAGCIIGQVPYYSLTFTQGNAGFMNDYYRFNRMGNTLLASDRYAQLHLNWNAGGLLFNQIPYVNRWGLREIVSAKIAFGRVSDDHVNTLPAHAPLQSVGTMPYAEAGIGIGNILGILGVESIWRLTYRTAPGAANWGVKFRLELGL